MNSNNSLLINPSININKIIDVMNETKFCEQSFKEQSYMNEILKQYAVEVIRKSYNLDENNKQQNTLFLENEWLLEKNNIDEKILRIIVKDIHNTYLVFKEDLITFLLENLRLPDKPKKQEDEESGYLSFLFGTSKKKNNDNKESLLNNTYTYYIYTTKNIYYTDGNVNKFNKFFTKIPNFEVM